MSKDIIIGDNYARLQNLYKIKKQKGEKTFGK